MTPNQRFTKTTAINKDFKVSRKQTESGDLTSAQGLPKLQLHSRPLKQTPKF